MEKKKMGRPTTDPRTEKIGIRISKKELQLLQECAEALNITRANVIIEAVKKLHKEVVG